MPRHPPIALKTLDRSHCQCPSGEGRDWHKKTSFSRSVRGLRLGVPIMGRGLRVPGDEPHPSSPGRSRKVMDLPGPGSGHGTRTNLLFTISSRTGGEPGARRKPCLPANDPAILSHRWWSRTGSNRRPPACKAGALPAELRPLISPERKWWAWEDLNLRPHAYQARALTN